MATSYMCDRCGLPCTRGMQKVYEVTLDWPDGEAERETVVLSFVVTRPKVDDEKPDLCNDCQADILHETASMLDSDSLSAAAPELLASLKALRDPAFGNPGNPQDTARAEAAADAALAKAEGRAVATADELRHEDEAVL